MPEEKNVLMHNTYYTHKSRNDFALKYLIVENIIIKHLRNQFNHYWADSAMELVGEEHNTYEVNLINHWFI